jgi:hypothetical protein
VAGINRLPAMDMTATDENDASAINKTRYDAFRDDYKEAFKLSGAYARWLISTLLLLHSGAIAAIFQKIANCRRTAAYH